MRYIFGEFWGVWNLPTRNLHLSKSFYTLIVWIKAFSENKSEDFLDPRQTTTESSQLLDDKLQKHVFNGLYVQQRLGLFTLIIFNLFKFDTTLAKTFNK